MGGSGLGFGVGGYAGARLGQPNGLVPCWAERPRGGGGLASFFLLCFVFVLPSLLFISLFLFSFTYLIVYSF